MNLSLSDRLRREANQGHFEHGVTSLSIRDFAEEIGDTEGHCVGDDVDPDKFLSQVDYQAELLEPFRPGKVRFRL